MKIYRIETGKVRIKQNQITRTKGLAPQMAKVLFGKEWSDWLPIYAWAIEHEEGVIVVDTGETSKSRENGYFPSWHPYYALAVEFDVAPEDEIGPQLKKLGIDPVLDVKRVILTHLHTDHAGGLHHFPKAEIMIEQSEYKAASGLSGILAGYLPHRWPKWMDPQLFELPDAYFGSFAKSLPVTRDKKVMIVGTPGHVKHHISVIVEHEDLYYFLAGDASYTQKNMFNTVPDGIGTKESMDSLKRIKSFTEQFPTLYLPSHDPDVPKRMERKETVQNFQTTAAKLR